MPSLGLTQRAGGRMVSLPTAGIQESHGFPAKEMEARRRTGHLALLRPARGTARRAGRSPGRTARPSPRRPPGRIGRTGPKLGGHVVRRAGLRALPTRRSRCRRGGLVPRTVPALGLAHAPAGHRPRAGARVSKETRAPTSARAIERGRALRFLVGSVGCRVHLPGRVGRRRQGMPGRKGLPVAPGSRAGQALQAGRVRRVRAALSIWTRTGSRSSVTRPGPGLPIEPRAL